MTVTISLLSSHVHEHGALWIHPAYRRRPNPHRFLFDALVASQAEPLILAAVLSNEVSILPLPGSSAALAKAALEPFQSFTGLLDSSCVHVL